MQSLLRHERRKIRAKTKKIKKKRPRKKAAKAEADEAPDFEVKTEKRRISATLLEAFGALGDVGKQIVPQAQKLVRQVDDLTGGMIGGIGKGGRQGAERRAEGGGQGD